MKSLVVKLFVVGFVYTSSLSSQTLDPYAKSPDWYKPGHPLDPAEPVNIQTLPGFNVEKLLTVPREAGSVTAMAVDDQGNLIVGTQHQRGLYRIRPSAQGSLETSTFEPLQGEGAMIGWAQGLLYAFDSLYVTVADENESMKTGLYRLLDTDQDGIFDQTHLLVALDGSGEHGPHGMVSGPEGEYIYMMCGNGTPLPDFFQSKSTVRTEGIDHLMPPGFNSTEYTEGGWVVRMEPDGSNPHVIGGGLRNSYDLAFNDKGDLFTYDSDMEYDLGSPFYRPTRICHIVSGSEFGWRRNAGKWPEYCEDSVPPVVNIGPGSPTGIVFGYPTTFPEKYRTALFAMDWTFATLYAIHLEPKGASYVGTVEIFVSGLGLPFTDLVVGSDGALYFSVGGRRLGSAIYRIWYSGPPADDGISSIEFTAASEHRDLRLSLESYHGRQDPKVVDRVWDHLGSEDWAVRYAARIALESQPTEIWRERALSERKLQARLPTLLALARQGNQADLLNVLDQLNVLDFSGLSEEGLLLALRIYEISYGRGGAALKQEGSSTVQVLNPLLPHQSSRANRELSRMLCYLGDSGSIDSLLSLMEQDGGDQLIAGAGNTARNFKYGTRVLRMLESAPLKERMHHAQMLNWISEDWTMAQREQYFSLVIDAIRNSQGGKGYLTYWEQILNAAKASLSEQERNRLSGLWEGLDETIVLPTPKGPGRIWEFDYLMDRIKKGFGQRKFENGKKMYAAASCLSCHAMNEDGGILGPSLTSVGQRFTMSDLLESIINPSKTISDQYQIVTLKLRTGEILSGRIQSKDASKTTLAPNAFNPMQTRSISNSHIVSSTPLAISTMPPALLNSLNEEEVLDLIAYIMAGGQSDHLLFQANKARK
jgi:putative heme-binding domain-containing protein